MQKTNFKYEILIHDDASTDETPGIIREFEKKYPAVIKPIYQRENQYSKGIKVGKINKERAKGKYIALCEGDDYWIDPHKLQKQVDYMEAHPECSLCVHAAYRVDAAKKKMKKHLRPNRGNKIYTTEEIIEGGGAFFATNSILYLSKAGINLPDFYENAPVGDYPLVIYLSLQGEAYYVDEFMSAYRAGVPNSWHYKIFSNVRKYVEYIVKRNIMFDEINKYTEYRYNEVIKKLITRGNFNVLMAQMRYKEIKEGEYKEIYDSLKMQTKIKIFIKQYFPTLVKTLINLKRKYRS